MRTATYYCFALFALVALSACSGNPPHEPRVVTKEQCHYPNTWTCDHHAGEDFNCSCERGGKLQDIVDVY